jgi:glycosyltransferase involved in cell wall biosynthesis
MTVVGAVESLAPRTYLVGCDAKNDTRVFSGSTYHLALEGIRDGLITGMVNLHPRGTAAWWIYAKAAWWKLLGGGDRHGFIFTDGFLDGVWRRNLPMLRGSVVINNFQLFGSHFLQSYHEFEVRPYCYIDGTLGEYFVNYRAFDTAQIDATAMAQATAAERDSYAACRKIVVMSKRSAAHLVRHYDVPPGKVRVIPPGANIPERLLEGLEREQPQRRRPVGKSLVIGFIGLYPERKGLPTIADAVRLARRDGYDIRLHVIGNCPPVIAQREGVSCFGLIDKRVDIDHFVEIVRNVDIGCMLSRAEMAGVALLEFLRLGVPVIATDVGGIPDIIDLGAGELVPAEIRADELAEHLAQLIDDSDRLTHLRELAWRRRHNASWRRPVQELKDVLDR